MYLYKDGVGKEYLIHRLVASTFIPNPLNLPQVNHKDGNKLNNFVGNLEWCTPLENTTHAVNTNLRDTLGENNPASVLTEDIALDIKNMKSKNMSFKLVRSKYPQYKYSTLYDCYNNRTWIYLKGVM